MTYVIRGQRIDRGTTHNLEYVDGGLGEATRRLHMFVVSHSHHRPNHWEFWIEEVPS